jgi:phage terminase large subunit-like protein
MARVVIGVDPASTSGPDADHTGIVVVGRSAFDGRAYVLGDRTCRLSPDGWGHRVMQATLDYHADVVVLETNQGGEMAEQVINSAARAMRLPIPRLRKIHAKESKRLRAEPIAALYEQGRVHHAITASGMAADLSQLEDEMISFTPDSGFSPDRIDALVHALTELCLSTRPTLRFHA